MTIAFPHEQCSFFLLFSIQLPAMYGVSCVAFLHGFLYYNMLTLRIQKVSCNWQLNWEHSWYHNIVNPFFKWSLTQQFWNQDSVISSKSAFSLWPLAEYVSGYEEVVLHYGQGMLKFDYLHCLSKQQKKVQSLISWLDSLIFWTADFVAIPT